jgi:hypothetical protein
LVKQDEEQVKLLAAFLKDNQIKALIKDMKTISGGVPSDSESLEKLFHVHGVNMRYLGAVYKDLKVNPKKKEGEVQGEEDIHFNGDFKHLTQIVEKEMFLRSAKHVLCQILRDQVNSDLYVSSVISHLLNCILAPNAQLDALDSGNIRWVDNSLLQSEFDFFPEETFQNRSRSSSMCSNDKSKPVEKTS